MTAAADIFVDLYSQAAGALRIFTQDRCETQNGTIPMCRPIECKIDVVRLCYAAIILTEALFRAHVHFLHVLQLFSYSQHHSLFYCICTMHDCGTVTACA